MNDHLFEVWFRDQEPKGYERKVRCLGVPRVGEVVYVDDLCGKVTAVVWNVTSGVPNGRSVTVYIENARREPITNR